MLFPQIIHRRRGDKYSLKKSTTSLAPPEYKINHTKLMSLCTGCNMFRVFGSGTAPGWELHLGEEKGISVRIYFNEKL